MIFKKNQSAKIFDQYIGDQSESSIPESHDFL